MVIWVLYAKTLESEKSDSAMKDDYETELKKQAAADVLSQYSRFVMACIGNQVRPCDLRMHLMKEISSLPTTLKRESRVASSPDIMGESSSSGTSKLDKTDSFRDDLNFAGLIMCFQEPTPNL
ncbi:unnamed protein product [Cuscuta epithymum]|uniref:Uncharacterized protein n=1 Tax=Cuscuta epithymum TaxID=186058 RepID=A0AAV0FA52_9ASTE|nr:unnamed protein product [Cuscuta epithymum]